ncbi:hypothetical protein [Verrucomicrobium spinosum]|uniref:hypothetical protein n=1 Tax=Verrucomicrobium spinosum TaxID=2736 RepID=UPI000A5F5426|nr:hypothetical protein [Verrucomicrobium spinosum]
MMISFASSESACNLNQLTLAKGQICDRCGGQEASAQLVQQDLSALPHHLVADENALPGSLPRKTLPAASRLSASTSS